jgi:hypothetical protein
MRKTVYKYGSVCYETQKKTEVVQSFMEDMRLCQSVNVKINKSSITVYVPGDKYSCVFNMPKPYLSCIPAEVERAEQWVADVYHCSDIWGQQQTEDDMFLELTETMKQKDPDDYSPDPVLYRECAAYWNQLCSQYPN